MSENLIPYLDDEARLSAYTAITNGCIHLWSKGKLVEERFNTVAGTFAKLAKEDPQFLAHFTSYAIMKMNSKDLQVVSLFFNSISDADGTPFETGSEYKKPDLRIISQAGLLMIPPERVLRVIQLVNLKKAYGNQFREGTHFSRKLKTALKKYLRYREQNTQMIRGLKKAGLGNKYKNLYRSARIAPSDQAASILRWPQKDGRKIVMKAAFSFKGLSNKKIAEKIREEKLSPLVALGALPGKITPVVAVAILEQATGNQVVILQSMFDEQGLLSNKDVKALFIEKLKTAGDALDRVERINRKINPDVEQTLQKSKAKKRKEATAGIGRIYVHIDVSSSMNLAIEFAKEKGAIIAECIHNPEENFHWSAFNQSRIPLPKPSSFEKAAFMQALYGLRSGGCTDCLACYEDAREKKCDVDIYITDQGHYGVVNKMKDTIARCNDKGYAKPKAAVIVNFGSPNESRLYDVLVEQGIPTTIMEPKTLTESAQVSQAVATAMKGVVAIIDEIMATNLLKLPKWWDAVPGK